MDIDFRRMTVLCERISKTKGFYIFRFFPINAGPTNNPGRIYIQTEAEQISKFQPRFKVFTSCRSDFSLVRTHVKNRTNSTRNTRITVTKDREISSSEPSGILFSQKCRTSWIRNLFYSPIEYQCINDTLYIVHLYVYLKCTAFSDGGTNFFDSREVLSIKGLFIKNFLKRS